MWRVSEKFMPKLLTMEQTQLSLEVSQDMLYYANSDPEFLNNVTTGDESWVYRYYPGTQAQSHRGNIQHPIQHPRGQQKARQVRSNVKMLTVLFDSRWVVYHKYEPQGQNINKEYYLEGLRCLHDAVRRKRPDLWAAGAWQLHHDNTPANCSQLIQTFLARHNIPVVQQAPYSPDMAPCDFWLFPYLNTQLKGTQVTRGNYMEHDGQADHS
jgi:histone-lysine N-methyltransferase SETMAR